MKDVILRHDGSFDGFLSAVFTAYERKLIKGDIRLRITTDKTPPDLFARSFDLNTDPEKAQRVWQRLNALWGAEGVRYFLKGSLHDCAERDNVLLGVIRHSIANAPRSVFTDYAHDDILTLSQWVKSVQREMHRMKAFVRFAKAADGTYCAPIAPDFDVLPLIAPFFARRYADQRWLIADMRRQYAVYYDLTSTNLLALDEAATQGWQQQNVDAEEPFYQRLWQDYFRATNIKERANRRLHVQHMPLRYWRYLTEKQTPKQVSH